MGHDLDLTREDLDRIENAKSKLKAIMSYKIDDDFKIPDLENNFTPNKIKSNKSIKTEIVDLKKKNSKSNKLI